MIFTADCKLKFDADCIKQARERLKEISKMLNSSNIKIELSEEERLFDEGDL